MGRPAAAVFAAALAGAAWLYPFAGTPLAPLLLGYGALLCWRPTLWLALLPALLPVLDLAPWTGWFFLEEIDLFLFLSAAAGYWRLGRGAARAVMPRALAGALVLVTLAYAIACVRGLLPLEAPGLNSFANYLSPYNALRVAKGWFWALLLLPVLAHDAGPGLERLRTHFMPGMLAGFALAALAATHERISFPGLLNLASDYRTSAPFSAMHTGGAALDGYLALGFPLLALWLVNGTTRLKAALALALLGLGAYAGLTTFSRGLYLAYGAAALVLLALTLAPRVRQRALGLHHIALASVLLALAAAALLLVFSGSGYRGLLAALLVVFAAAVLGTQRIGWSQLLTALVLASGIEAALVTVLSLPGGSAPAGFLKPPYLLFALSCAAFAIASIRPGRPVAALAAFFAMLLNLAYIGWHWNGAAGLRGSVGAIALAAGLVALQAGSRRVPWAPSRASAACALAVALVLGFTVPVAGSYYAAERFASTSADLDTRLMHWRRALLMMDHDAASSMFGMGLGRYPAMFYWRNPARETPASFAYFDEGGNRALRLFAPQYARGYGEVIRILQRLPIAPHTDFVLSADVRRRDKRALVDIALCERQLLYPQNCVRLPLRLGPPDTRWRHYVLPFNSGLLNGAGWITGAPVQLEISIGNEHMSIDIDNLSIVDPASGAELLRNGSFAKGNERWFFSSDRHHLPWHVKNLALNQYVEQGWFGLAALLLLVGGAGVCLVRRALQGETEAAVYAAALTGFLIVGQFDSLLDVPRIALIFYLFLFAAVLRAAPLNRARARAPVHSGPAQ